MRKKLVAIFFVVAVVAAFVVAVVVAVVAAVVVAVVVAAVVVAAAVVVPQFNLESRKKFVITLLDDLHIVYPSLVI